MYRILNRYIHRESGTETMTEVRYVKLEDQEFWRTSDRHTEACTANGIVFDKKYLKLTYKEKNKYGQKEINRSHYSFIHNFCNRIRCVSIEQRAREYLFIWENVCGAGTC